VKGQKQKIIFFLHFLVREGLSVKLNIFCHVDKKIFCGLLVKKHMKIDSDSQRALIQIRNTGKVSRQQKSVR
jgi:hypothetical protein